MCLSMYKYTYYIWMYLQVVGTQSPFGKCVWKVIEIETNVQRAHDDFVNPVRYIRMCVRGGEEGVGVWGVDAQISCPFSLPTLAVADAAAANNPFLLLLLVFSLTFLIRARSPSFKFDIYLIRSFGCEGAWKFEPRRQPLHWDVDEERAPQNAECACESDIKWECGSAKCLPYSVSSRAVAMVSRVPNRGPLVKLTCPIIKVCTYVFRTVIVYNIKNV